MCEFNGLFWGKKIVILGFVFKDGINDMCNSIVVYVIKDLVMEMLCEIVIFDFGCVLVEICEEVEKVGLIVS